ncbi:MAG: rhodanese-like domain-containing protein [Acidimicrobiia bacterium]
MAANPNAMVSAEWVGERLDDPGVAFLHIGGARSEYESGHLPRAVWADGYGDFTAERDGIRALVPLKHEMEATLGRLGIDESMTVVCTASGKSMWPSRAYWVLRYYRFPRLHVADRSVAALAKAGLPVTRDEIEVHGTTCRLGEPDASVLSVADEVLAAAEGRADAMVLDCRTDEEFRGETPGSHPAPRAGRVPRATHLNWELLMDADGRFLASERLRALYAAAGIDGTKPVYPYCGGGIRSAASWFAMYEILGWDAARNYDGSWAEWSRRSHLPVEAGR